MGNIHSVNKALELQGAKTIVSNKSKEILSAEKIVLPGVGAFDDAMEELKKKDLIYCILEVIKNGKPFLGICLGMQILFETSEEAKETKGLGVFKGSVKRFKEDKGIKVPHMGWNQLSKIADNCPLMNGVPDKSFVYFCHSYYPLPKDNKLVSTTTEYGINFASSVWQGNVFGMQFHPEKSQEIGLKMINNFVNL